MLVAAALVIVLTGLVHSVLGELLLFKNITAMQGWPDYVDRFDPGRQIVRVTWHLATIFAWCLAALVWHYAHHTPDRFVIQTIAAALLASALLTFAGTRARHPGWLALLAAAILCWLE